MEYHLYNKLIKIKKFAYFYLIASLFLSVFLVAYLSIYSKSLDKFNLFGAVGLLSRSFLKQNKSALVFLILLTIIGVFVWIYWIINITRINYVRKYYKDKNLEIFIEYTQLLNWSIWGLFIWPFGLVFAFMSIAYVNNILIQNQDKENVKLFVNLDDKGKCQKISILKLGYNREKITTELLSLKKDQIKEIAQSLGINNYSNLSMSELANLIFENWHLKNI
ncbi:hypothetical protein NPA08_03945 [Mycoplasmopsis citelli]|uniref:Uncharacterized protein n=1 Tax=Mycoplasmopsis citelli TaxID=171281 RepID=A0A449B219_9BACT|nr:hypothetical protein [Mycoplasmopsis citelli]UUD36078.1 hypothetical protein NPA08_03945 [Mycoplasmopsis citelli]VEU74623.1 Uncharacterised protein [Mycoplasmopsis citelli]